MNKVIPTNTLVLQKIIAFFITIGIFLASGSAYGLMLTAIILGHSHFLLGMIYKITSPRRIPAIRIAGFAAVGIILFGLFYRPGNPDFRIDLLLLITTLYAIYHTVVDDEFSVNFFTPGYSLLQKMEMGALILVWSAIHLKWQYLSTWTVYLVLTSILLTFLYGMITVKNKFILGSQNYYFLALWVFSIFVYFANVTFFNQQLFVVSFIGIYHYLIYYLHYFLKLKAIKNPTRTLATTYGYLVAVLISNIVIFLLYFISQFTNNIVLGQLFSYNFFLVITLLHFISSTRIREIATFFNFKNE